MANSSVLDLVNRIVSTLDEKKGEDILVLAIGPLCSFADYFVICSGSSPRTLKALAEEVSKSLKESDGLLAKGVEGEPESGWVLLDYGDVILHLFLPSTRAYYRLEELWRDGQVVVHLR